MATEVDANSALAEFSEALFRNTNVVSVAVVPETDATGNSTGEFIVEAGVADLALQSAVARGVKFKTAEDYERAVPSQLPVRTEQDRQGRSKRVVRVSVVHREPVRALSFIDTRRPAEGGNSIGIVGLGGSGTLGSRVTVNGQDGYFISNWHVLHAGIGSNGSVIVQRGPGDGGTSPVDRIGTLYWWALNQFADAAVGKVDAISQLTWSFRCGGQVVGNVPAAVGMDVKKCGRTSRLTTGRVTSVNASVRVSGYPGGTRVFSDQIELTQILSPGDSGSLICSTSNQVVGLGFAGSSQRSYANKFQRVAGLTEAGISVNEDGSTESSEIRRLTIGPTR